MLREWNASFIRRRHRISIWFAPSFSSSSSSNFLAVAPQCFLCRSRCNDGPDFRFGTTHQEEEEILFYVITLVRASKKKKKSFFLLPIPYWGWWNNNNNNNNSNSGDESNDNGDVDAKLVGSSSIVGLCGHILSFLLDTVAHADTHTTSSQQQQQ